MKENEASAHNGNKPDKWSERFFSAPPGSGARKEIIAEFYESEIEKCRRYFRVNFSRLREDIIDDQIQEVFLLVLEKLWPSDRKDIPNLGAWVWRACYLQLCTTAKRSPKMANNHIPIEAFGDSESNDPYSDHALSPDLENIQLVEFGSSGYPDTLTEEINEDLCNSVSQAELVRVLERVTNLPNYPHCSWLLKEYIKIKNLPAKKSQPFWLEASRRLGIDGPLDKAKTKIRNDIDRYREKVFRATLLDEPVQVWLDNLIEDQVLKELFPACFSWRSLVLKYIGDRENIGKRFKKKSQATLLTGTPNSVSESQFYESHWSTESKKVLARMKVDLDFAQFVAYIDKHYKHRDLVGPTALAKSMDSEMLALAIRVSNDEASMEEEYELFFASTLDQGILENLTLLRNLNIGLTLCVMNEIKK